MTNLAYLLVGAAVGGGLVWLARCGCAWLAGYTAGRRRLQRTTPYTQPRHCRTVKHPYDWEKQP